MQGSAPRVVRPEGAVSAGLSAGGPLIPPDPAVLRRSQLAPRLTARPSLARQVLRKDIRVQDLRLDDNAVPVRNAHITLADKLQ